MKKMFPLSLDLALIAFGEILNCEFFEKMADYNMRVV